MSSRIFKAFMEEVDQLDEKQLEELQELQFDIFNSDINLLSVHILLEAFARGQNTLILADFIKGDYWKIDEISDEARDTGDFSSTQDLVLSQVLHTIDYLRLGEVKKISVVSINGVLDAVLKEALTSDPKKDELDDMAGYYSAVIDNIYDLKKISHENIEKLHRRKKTYDGEEWRKYYNRVDLTKDNYHRHLEYIVAIGAPFIEIEVEFSKKGMQRLEREMRNFVFTFANDDLIEREPNYRDKRLYFSKQLENLVEYVNKFPSIYGEVNIPFEALSENGFEFVKVVSVLEYLGKLKVRNWGDKSLWNIRFAHTPVTVQSLALSNEPEEIEADQEKLKSDLSFSEEKGKLKIGDKEASFRKGTRQYHFVRIIFSEPKELGKEWFFSEIGEKYDSEEELDDKRFANIAYQVKQRIRLDTGISDFFITTKQSATINPKYLP